MFLMGFKWGHGGAVVTYSPPTSEVDCSNPGSYVGKLVVAQAADGWQFTVQSLDQLYVLVSSAHKTAHHDMTCTVLKATYNPK